MDAPRRSSEDPEIAVTRESRPAPDDSNRAEARADATTRAAGRYLDLLRDALLGEHYLENELRIRYLLECFEGGRDFDLARLANPPRRMASRMRELVQERQAGELPGVEGGAEAVASSLAYAPMGRTRLEELRTCLEVLRTEEIDGDLVDVDLDRGGAAIFMRGFLDAYELPAVRVWAVDRFNGGGSDSETQGIDAFRPEFNSVREGFARFGLLDERVAFLQGPPDSTLAASPIEEIALLRIGSRDPAELEAVLAAAYERVATGGYVLVDGYGAPGCQEVVDGFRDRAGAGGPLERIDWSGAAWRKSAHEVVESAPRDSGGLMPIDGTNVESEVKELSVIVVVHNMRRAGPRTLHSLSRSYQRGVEELDYEVIVVENGSDPDQRLGEALVHSWGPEFRYVDLGDEAAPSPAGAINRGIDAATAPVLALMIDGAHMLTPGVLRFGMLGLRAYEPAIVTARQWYLGPGQQPEMVTRGYSEELEDGLLDEIDWPVDGYRLFEVGHFIGDRDWFDGEWESNCIFVPRTLLQQFGGMDESFSAPGGGFVNLDFFERMVGAPGVTLVTMLGEGSFHQVHGGTTTNATNPTELINEFDDAYEGLRGRRFQVPPQQAHYVGSLPPYARRTRPRRMSEFGPFRAADDGASAAASPMPVPDELKTSFVDASWRSGEWHRTRWLGQRVHRPPTDLFAYQELIWRLRPDWIVETRTAGGGRAGFLASICELIGHGQVLSIDSYRLANPPAHPRISYLRGDPAAERTAARALELVGSEPRAIVILGAAAAAQVLAAFRNYSKLVPVGSYVVIEDTILAGHPVWEDFGTGPTGAAKEIAREGDFVPDPSLERWALTFNIGGFLKRVR